MEELIQSDWSFGQDVLLSPYKLAMLGMTEQEEESGMIDNRFSVMEKKI